MTSIDYGIKCLGKCLGFSQLLACIRGYCSQSWLDSSYQTGIVEHTMASDEGRQGIVQQVGHS